MDNIYSLWLNGLITDPEALDFFDQIQIRGHFEGSSFIGYDYKYQEWVYLTPETIH